MKKNIKTVLSTLLISAISITGALAQHHGKHEGGKDRHGKRDHGEHHMEGRHHGRMVALTTIYGKVGAFVAGKDYIVDGFTLTSDAGSFNIKFPSHLGSQVTSLFKTGSPVSVTGFSDITRHGEQVFRANSINGNKNVVYDVPPTHPTTAPVENMVNISAKIAAYDTAKDGKTNGFFLANKTIVHVSPHVASQIVTLAPVGSIVGVQGTQRTLHEGEVQLEKWTIIAASVITINGQQYLVR